MNTMAYTGSGSQAPNSKDIYTSRDTTCRWPIVESSASIASLISTLIIYPCLPCYTNCSNLGDGTNFILTHCSIRMKVYLLHTRQKELVIFLTYRYVVRCILNSKTLLTWTVILPLDITVHAALFMSCMLHYISHLLTYLNRTETELHFWFLKTRNRTEYLKIKTVTALACCFS